MSKAKTIAIIIGIIFFAFSKSDIIPSVGTLTTIFTFILSGTIFCFYFEPKKLLMGLAAIIGIGALCGIVSDYLNANVLGIMPVIILIGALIYKHKRGY